MDKLCSKLVCLCKPVKVSDNNHDTTYSEAVFLVMCDPSVNELCAT